MKKLKLLLMNLKLEDNRSSYPKTFKEDLNYQCRQILTFASFITLSWLFFIPIDLQLHPDKYLIIAFRIAFPIIGMLLFLSRFTKTLRNRNLFMLTVYIAYLEFSTSILTGITGGDSAYIGGFIFIVTLIIVAPLQKITAYCILAVSFILFFSVSFLSGMDFTNPRSLYSLNNIICVYFIASCLIHILNNTRYRNWLKSKQLEIGKEEIQKLSGLLPICASCKKIRDDKGYWLQLEKYISAHSGAHFTHGICPECAEKLYPEFIK